MLSLIKSHLPDLTEASTWRGIVSIITVCGVAISPEQGTAIIAFGMATSGLIKVFFKDKLASK